LSVDRYDLAVVGGGPAGAVAGMVSARLGLRTIVLEAATSPNWKPGEVLAPECNPVLKALGLWTALATRRDLALSSAGVRSRWGSGDVAYRDGFREPSGAGWVIDRVAFETLLSERAIAAGVRWIWGARVSSVARQEGRSRSLGARRIRHQMQIASVVRCPSTQAQSSWVDIESAPDGWWYSAHDPGGNEIIAWFGDCADPALGCAEMRAEFATLHRKIFNADSSSLDRCAGEAWFAIGDAATAFDPIASQGLMNALASANAAARAVHGSLDGERESARRYPVEMSRAYEFYLQGMRSHYRIERRWSHRPFWKTRHAGRSHHADRSSG
jgi:flavin-dependent dehydrogenase